MPSLALLDVDRIAAPKPLAKPDPDGFHTWRSLFVQFSGSTVADQLKMIYTSTSVSMIGGSTHMQVAKWGNSLAVRLPAAVVDALELKEGDQIEIRVAGDREFEVSRDRSRQKALERLRRLRRPLPAGFTFDREEVHER